MKDRSAHLSTLGALILAVFLGIEVASYHRAQNLLGRHLKLSRQAGIPSHVYRQLENDSQTALAQHLQQAFIALLLLLLIFRLTIIRQEKELNRLRIMEKRAYELTDNVPAGTYVLTLSPRADGQVDLEFRFASRRFLEIFGVTREALLNDANVVLQSVHVDDRASMDAANALAFATCEPFHWEGRLMVDGCTRWYAISSNPRRAPDGIMVWEGVVTDINDRVEAQQDLKHSVQREIDNEKQRRILLEQKLKTSLTAAAALHELQQPLAAILLNAQLAARAVSSLPVSSRPVDIESQLKALAVDGDQVMAAMERVRLLLRNVETNPVPVDIANSVESALLYVHTQLKEKQIHVQREGLDQPCILEGDSAQIQIALVNLIRNALQAMENQTPAQRSLLVALRRHRGHVKLHVADSGPGFPVDYSADSSWELFKSTKVNGMGLGLFLARTAVLNHSGQLQIGRSKRLGGAEVTLVFPMTPQA